MSRVYDLKREQDGPAVLKSPRRTSTGTPVAPPITLSAPQDVVALQRLAGNKAVTSLLASRNDGGAKGGRQANGLDAVQRAPSFKSAKSALSSFGARIGSFFGRIGKGGKKVGDMANTAFAKAPTPAPEETGSEFLDAMSPTEREEHARKSAGSLGGAAPDYVDPTLADAEPDRFTVTVAVSQEDASWMRNIEDLRSAALHKVATSPKKLAGAVKSGGGEEYLGRKVLQYRGALDGKDEAEQSKLIGEFTQGLHNVGHTWIRLSSYSGGKLKNIYSYGMWPQKLYDPESGDNAGGYAGFATAGPGQIRHPDTYHEQDPTKAYKDYEISEEQFAKGLGRANELFQSPPPYVLIGYNCTAFAKEILTKTGQSYPGAGVLPGIAYTPGNLYWSIMKDWSKGKKGAHAGDEHADIVKKVEQDRQAREDSAHEDAAWDMVGMPSADAPREKIQVYKGSVLKYGDTPRVIDKEITLEHDMKLDYVDDEEWTDKTNVVPVEFGPHTLYVKYKSLVKASKPTSSPKPTPSPSPSGKLQLYLSQSDDLAAWQEIGAAELGDLTVTNHTDVETEAPQWRAKNPGVDVVGVFYESSFFWVVKSHLEQLRATGGSSGSSGPMLQLYTATSDKNLAPGEALPAGSLVRPSGMDVPDYLVATWRSTHPGVDLVSVYLNGEERIVIATEYQEFVTGGSSSSSDGGRSRSSSTSSDGGRSRSSSTSSEDGRSRSSSVSSEVAEHPELQRFDDICRTMMKAGREIGDALPNYADESDFVSLSPEGRAALAELMGITLENLETQISRL